MKKLEVRYRYIYSCFATPVKSIWKKILFSSDLNNKSSCPSLRTEESQCPRAESSWKMLSQRVKHQCTQWVSRPKKLYGTGHRDLKEYINVETQDVPSSMATWWASMWKPSKPVTKKYTGWAVPWEWDARKPKQAKSTTTKNPLCYFAYCKQNKQKNTSSTCLK